MSLKDRLKTKPEFVELKQEVKLPENSVLIKPAPSINNNEIEKKTLTVNLYELLLEKINSTPTWTTYSDEKQKELMTQFIEHQINFKHIGLEKDEKDLIIEEIIKKTNGLGPIDSLLENPNISSVFINGVKNIYAEKDGRLYKTETAFEDSRHLRLIIEKIVSRAGKKICEKNPIVEGILPDGSKINAIIPPISIDGPVLTIRKSKKDAQTLQNLVDNNVLTDEIAKTLTSAIKSNKNIIISGGIGAGKTTLLKALASEIPNEERIITIEEYKELNIKKENLIRLELKNLDENFSYEDLVQKAIRMQPDRIIIGECKSKEISGLMDATGNRIGVLTTIYSNSATDTISKLEKLAPQIAKAINMVVQVEKLNDGSRKVTSVLEISTKKEQNKTQIEDIKINEIFHLSSKVDKTINTTKKITSNSSIGIKFAENPKDEKETKPPKEKKLNIKSRLIQSTQNIMSQI